MERGQYYIEVGIVQRRRRSDVGGGAIE